MIAGTFPNWRKEEGLDYLPAEIQESCDVFKRDVLYQIVSQNVSPTEFNTWMESIRTDSRFTQQDFDTIIARFHEWLPIYSNPEWFAARRRQTLLGTWLPESRALPPALEIKEPTSTLAL